MSKRKCVVKGCDRDVRCKFMCSVHYGRVIRNGTTEALPRSGNKKTGISHNRFKHGKSGTKTYKVWVGMIERCENPNSSNYKNWGGKGIKVCEEWRQSFEKFLEDMGEAPEGLTIDRIDVSGHYEPKNCRWATRVDQARNRRYCKMTMEKAEKVRAFRENGETLVRLAERFGISPSHVKRICDGDAWAGDNDDGKAAQTIP